jgi:hypothetical protein
LRDILRQRAAATGQEAAAVERPVSAGDGASSDAADREPPAADAAFDRTGEGQLVEEPVDLSREE